MREVFVLRVVTERAELYGLERAFGLGPMIIRDSLHRDPLELGLGPYAGSYWCR